MNSIKMAELQKQHAQGKRIYSRKESKLWKRNYAPNGFVYLSIKYCDGKSNFTNHQLVPSGGTDEQKDEVYKTLWQQLVKKFPQLKAI